MKKLKNLWTTIILVLFLAPFAQAQNTEKFDVAKINEFSNQMLQKLQAEHNDVKNTVKFLQDFATKNLNNAHSEAELNSFKEFIKGNIEVFSLANKVKAEEKAQYLKEIANFYSQLLGIEIKAPTVQ